MQVTLYTPAASLADWVGASAMSTTPAIAAAGDHLLVNQHTYSIPAAQAPMFCPSNTGSSEMAALYLDSFERVGASATPVA